MSHLPTRILLATDGSDGAASAARAAAEISNETGAELHAVYVEPSVLGRNPSLTVIAGSLAPDASAEVYERILQDILEMLHVGVKQVEDAGGTVVSAHFRVGRPADEIVSLGEKLGADLVVVGSRRLGRVWRAVLGSVSEGVLRRAKVAVLVAPEEKRQGRRRRGIPR
jgi:nucleotide-binding universal stress UspA family protein